MAVDFENLIVGNGTFNQTANIETITVPANTTVARGTLLGKITSTGKYIVSLLAASDGSEVGAAIAQTDVENDTAGALDYKVVVYKAGSFNSTGVTFGTGQTVANTKDDLHLVSIEITEGVL